MAVAIGRDLKLSLRLCATYLARRTLLACIFLTALGIGQHFPGACYGGLAFSDRGIDVAAGGGESVDSDEHRGFTLAESIHQRSRFCCLAGDALVLSAKNRGAL